jgi:hypothetical protein
MSSDPFADLANSVASFAQRFQNVLSSNLEPAPGSPADVEASGEPFAGDWGKYPSRDIFATAYMTATSATDHLLALADVLRARNSVLATYTLTRGALEAASIGCYLTDESIDGRERLRRAMNYRLTGLCEKIWLLQGTQTVDVTDQLDEATRRIGEFKRSAGQHGFVFNDMNDRKGQSAYLDTRLPAAMELISRAIDETTPTLGRTSQRILSATTHSQLHGIARMLAPVALSSRSGEAIAAINREPSSLATELVVGPLAAFNLASRLEWFGGSDMTSLHGSANRMLLTWSRVAQLSVPGG